MKATEACAQKRAKLMVLLEQYPAFKTLKEMEWKELCEGRSLKTINPLTRRKMGVHS